MAPNNELKKKSKVKTREPFNEDKGKDSLDPTSLGTESKNLDLKDQAACPSDEVPSIVTKKTKKKKKNKKKKHEKKANSEAMEESSSGGECDQPLEEIIVISRKEQKKAAKAVAKAEIANSQSVQSDNKPIVATKIALDDAHKNSGKKRVKFGIVNHSKSYKASMKDLEKLKPKATLEVAPKFSILKVKKRKSDVVDHDGGDSVDDKSLLKRRKGTPHKKALN